MSSPNQITPPPQGPKRASKQLFYFLGAGVLASTFLLLGTNPDQSAYATYAAEQLPKHLKETNCDELEGNLSLAGIVKLPTKDACKSVINGADSVGRGVIQFFINQSTERKNLRIFSIYTTEAFGRKVTTLGIGQKFWTFQ